jgi:hypothetical protein
MLNFVSRPANTAPLAPSPSHAITAGQKLDNPIPNNTPTPASGHTRVVVTHAIDNPATARHPAIATPRLPNRSATRPATNALKPYAPIHAADNTPMSDGDAPKSAARRVNPNVQIATAKSVRNAQT